MRKCKLIELTEDDLDENKKVTQKYVDKIRRLIDIRLRQVDFVEFLIEQSRLRCDDIVSSLYRKCDIMDNSLNIVVYSDDEDYEYHGELFYYVQSLDVYLHKQSAHGVMFYDILKIYD